MAGSSVYLDRHVLMMHIRTPVFAIALAAARGGLFGCVVAYGTSNTRGAGIAVQCISGTTGARTAHPNPTTQPLHV